MKKAKLFIIIVVVNSLVQYLIPYWWIFSVVCFVSAYFFGQSSVHAFLSTSVGILVSWLAMMLVLEIPSHYAVSCTMAEVFPLKGNALLFYLLSIIVGTLLGGMSGLCGYVGKNLGHNRNSAS